MCKNCESSLEHQYIVYSQFDSFLYACNDCINDLRNDDGWYEDDKNIQEFNESILKKMTVKQLIRLAKENNIKGYSSKEYRLKRNLVWYLKNQINFFLNGR